METSVLVVGGGPVGLSCALDLAWRGIDCVLIERGDGVVRQSKMGLVAVRTMEFCRRWGIAEQVRCCGFPEDYPLNMVFCTSLAGYHLSTIAYPSMRDEPTPPESPERRQRCPQLWFDPILAAAVKTHDRHAIVRNHCELERLEQNDHRVLAHVRDLRTGTPFTVAAQYVVGCDGAGSTVRRALGIDYEGDVLSYSTGIYFRSPGLVARHDKGPAERYMLIGESGTWGNLTVIDGDAYWRLTITGPRNRVEATDFDADAALRRCLGDDSIPYQIDAVMPWRRSRLVASGFRSGRILLAGDAAHITAPNGGYGMNTGMADAVDVSWKLAALINGWGGPELPASYDTERRPVAWRAVNAAAVNFSALTPSLDFSGVTAAGAAGESHRRELGEAFDHSTRAVWETLGIALGYRYAASPLIVPDGSAPVEDDPIRYIPSARPGHRAPHAWIDAGCSTLDLFGRDLVLLRLGQDAPDPSPLVQAAARREVPLTLHTLPQQDIAALYERSLVLVRPDGHVAWRGDQLPDDPVALIDRVRGSAAIA